MSPWVAPLLLVSTEWQVWGFAWHGSTSTLEVQMQCPGPACPGSGVWECQAWVASHRLWSGDWHQHWDTAAGFHCLSTSFFTPSKALSLCLQPEIHPVFRGRGWYCLLFFIRKVLMASGYGGNWVTSWRVPVCWGVSSGEKGAVTCCFPAKVTVSMARFGCWRWERRAMSNCLQEQMMSSVCSDSQPWPALSNWNCQRHQMNPGKVNDHEIKYKMGQKGRILQSH